MLILSKNYDGRTGTGREAFFDLDYNREGGGSFSIVLNGTGWDEIAPEVAALGQGEPDDYRTGIQRVYYATVDAGTLDEWYALHAPRAIQFDWLSDHTHGKFATVAAMLATEFADGDPITGWAAVAANGG